MKFYWDVWSKTYLIFLNKNFDYKILSKSEILGKKHEVVSTFTIDKDGNLTVIKAIGKNESINQEIIRIFKLLPKFRPSLIRSKAIATSYSLYIMIDEKRIIRQ